MSQHSHRHGLHRQHREDYKKYILSSCTLTLVVKLTAVSVVRPFWIDKAVWQVVYSYLAGIASAMKLCLLSYCCYVLSQLPGSHTVETLCTKQSQACVDKCKVNSDMCSVAGFW